MAEKPGKVFNAPQTGQVALQIPADIAIRRSVCSASANRHTEDGSVAFVAHNICLISAYDGHQATTTLSVPMVRVWNDYGNLGRWLGAGIVHVNS